MLNITRTLAFAFMCFRIMCVRFTHAYALLKRSCDMRTSELAAFAGGARRDGWETGGRKTRYHSISLNDMEIQEIYKNVVYVRIKNKLTLTMK